MGRRHFKPEQIIQMLREAEIKLAGGKTSGEVCRGLGVSEQGYYRCRKEYGGLQVSQAEKLKDLMDHPTISGPTMAPSSRRQQYANGCIGSTCKRCSSSPVAPGRTVTTRASTASYAMNYSMAKSSAR